MKQSIRGRLQLLILFYYGIFIAPTTFAQEKWQYDAVSQFKFLSAAQVAGHGDRVQDAEYYVGFNHRLSDEKLALAV